MEAAVLTAIVSAIVSLIVTILTVYASKSTMRAEREKLERELQRSMTARLYDARIEAYPEAMQITEALRRHRLEDQGENLSEDYLHAILTKIDSWHATKAAFIISRNSLYKLYALRKVLREKPESNGRYSQEQVSNIRDAKGRFRAALRADIQLLFKEEESEEILDD